MNFPVIESSRLIIKHGHDPRVLCDTTDRLIVQTLCVASGKVMTKNAQGQHIERALDDEGRKIKGTRCYMNLEQYANSLLALLAPTPLSLPKVDRVNLYISPASCGAPLHFDVRDVCIIQLFGTKIWWVDTKIAVENPTYNDVFPEHTNTMLSHGKNLSRPTTLKKFLLKPGDWLHVPKGVWHQTMTETGSASASLAAPD